MECDILFSAHLSEHLDVASCMRSKSEIVSEDDCVRLKREDDGVEEFYGRKLVDVLKREIDDVIKAERI